MALLQIYRNKIDLIVKVGVLEEYQPDSDIKELHKDIEALRGRF